MGRSDDIKLCKANKKRKEGTCAQGTLTVQGSLSRLRVLT